VGHLALALTAPQFRGTWGPLEEELGAPALGGITWNIHGENQFFFASLHRESLAVVQNKTQPATRHGKHTKNRWENHHFSWVNPLFRLRHFQ